MGNSFLDSIIAKDKEVLVFFNSFGNEQWDGFWLFITNQFNWTPFFILILILAYLKLGIKKMLFLMLFLAVMIAFSDQLTNLVKNFTARTRPCNTPDVKPFLREFSYKPKGYSFWSGHAGVSTIVTTFIILLLRKHYKYIYLMVLFPMFFGYSRIYLGVHYPVDVTTGYIVGSIIGVLFYQLYKYTFKKVFKESLL